MSPKLCAGCRELTFLYTYWCMTVADFTAASLSRSCLYVSVELWALGLSWHAATFMHMRTSVNLTSLSQALSKP